MQPQKADHDLVAGELKLEPCPRPEQVMPPAEPAPGVSMVFSVAGQVIGGSLVLAMMLLLPALIAGLLPVH